MTPRLDVGWKQSAATITCKVAQHKSEALGIGSLNDSQLGMVLQQFSAAISNKFGTMCVRYTRFGVSL